MGRSRLSMAHLGKRGGKSFLRIAKMAVQLKEHKTMSHDVLGQANEVTSPARSSMFSSAGGSGGAAHSCGSCASTIASFRSACTNFRSCVPTAKTVLSPSKITPRRSFDPRFQLCINCACASIAIRAASLSPRPHPPSLISGVSALASGRVLKEKRWVLLKITTKRQGRGG